MHPHTHGSILDNGDWLNIRCYYNYGDSRICNRCMETNNQIKIITDNKNHGNKIILIIKIVFIDKYNTLCQ